MLGSKTFLAWIPARKAVVKTSFIKIIDENTTVKEVTSLEATASYKKESEVPKGVGQLMDLEENPAFVSITDNQSEPSPGSH